jgi:S-disulfanyl-L-cysteine oxidoreductase SoxD
MKFSTAVLALAAVWALGVIHSSLHAQTPKSVWEGAYTDEQAKRGEEAYMKDCSECHQAELTGDGFAPGLSGAEFLNAWNGLTVGDLFERIRISMPPGKETSVPAQSKADIVAHILKFNKFPAGKTDLPAQTDALKGIKFEATKPGH